MLDEARIVISNWLSSYSTIDFLAAWETLYNPNFNRTEFQTVRNEPGRLVLTAKQWRDETGNKKENMRDYASVE